MLVEVGLEPVVCASAPTGGRHVWVSLAESVDPTIVATLARFTQKLCPSLDLSPMASPAAGRVRPPGAPHRHGGYSTPISGNPSVLAAPTRTVASVVLLVERLATLIEAREPSPPWIPSVLCHWTSTHANTFLGLAVTCPRSAQPHWLRTLLQAMPQQCCGGS